MYAYLDAALVVMYNFCLNQGFDSLINNQPLKCIYIYEIKKEK